MTPTTQRTPAQDTVLIAQLRDIYDAYRSAQLTRRYYESRLESAGTSTSQSSLLLTLTISAALLVAAVLFPQFAPLYVLIMCLLLVNQSRVSRSNPDVPRYAALASAFHAHALSLREVVNKVHNTHDLPHELLAVYTASRRQIAEMELPIDEPADEALLKECYEQINREISARGLWVPKVPDHLGVKGNAMDDAIHQTRLGGQVAITPRVGHEPPAPWPMPWHA